MRHAFSFPLHIRAAIQAHVNRAVFGIAAERYRQEPDYVPVLFHSLEGVAYDDLDGLVKFSSTVATSYGPGTAERPTGIDCALTAIISDGVTTIRKAILVQAKLGLVSDLNPGSLHELLGQVRRMMQLSRSPKVMEIPEAAGFRIPHVLSGRRLVASQSYQSLPLPDYIVRRVTTTMDGDTRPEFVDAVQDSNMTELRVIAELREQIKKTRLIEL